MSMTPEQVAREGLLSQEIESLASCIARGQAPDTYQDIVEKVRGHISKLGFARAGFWNEQVKSLGVDLFPTPPERKKVDKKPGGASVP